MANPVAFTVTQPPVPMAVDIEIDRKGRYYTLYDSVNYAIHLWPLKIVVAVYFFMIDRFSRRPARLRPTYTRRYASRPQFQARVFIPDTYKPDDAPLPLLIDVHGGGFSMGSAVMDDMDNSRFCRKHGLAVVSIDYSLGPVHKFPTAVEDIAAQIEDVLNDDSLPVDRNRVALIGYSAGGNLILTASQMRGLARRVSAAIAYYPVVDYVMTYEHRRDKHVPRPDGVPDYLVRTAPWFNWSYIPQGQALRDPRLSPRYAHRDSLPRSIYLIGGEHDSLCHEAWTMAEELATREEGSEKTQRITDGDEGWECGRIRWRRVTGVEHGFNALASRQTGTLKDLYTRKTLSAQDDVVEWLHRVAWR